jgi:CheY-like chemotaxis protein
MDSEPQRPEKLRVLMIDDDDILTKQWTSCFTEVFGTEYGLSVANDTEAAVRLGPANYDLVIYDCMLPYLEEITDEIKAAKSLIVYTAHGEKQAREELDDEELFKRSVYVEKRPEVKKMIGLIRDARAKQLAAYAKAHDAWDTRKHGKPGEQSAGEGSSGRKEIASLALNEAEGLARNDGLKEWADFIAALNALGVTAESGFAEMAMECEKTVTGEENTGRSLVLYADDIVERAAVYDLQYTVKNILARHGVLAGGKVVLFARKAANARILGDMIRAADPSIETVTIDEARVGVAGDEVRELDKVVRLARAEGAKDIMAVIKGPILDAEKTEPLRAFAMESRIPLVVLGRGENIYSFAQAIAMAISAKSSDGARTGWLIMLPAVRSVTEDIRAEYEAYKRSLEALRNA